MLIDQLPDDSHSASASQVASEALSAGAAQAAQITVMSWGGTYTKSQVEAYYTPFTAKTGINVVSVDSDNPAIPIKAQVEAKNVTTDVVDIEYADAIRLCDEGLLEPIDPAGTYTVASGSFLIGGGDNFSVLAEGADRKDTGLIDTDAFVNYFSARDVVDPDFRKQAIAVSDAPSELTEGDEVSFTVSDVDLPLRVRLEDDDFLLTVHGGLSLDPRGQS